MNEVRGGDGGARRHQGHDVGGHRHRVRGLRAGGVLRAAARLGLRVRAAGHRRHRD